LAIDSYTNKSESLQIRDELANVYNKINLFLKSKLEKTSFFIFTPDHDFFILLTFSTPNQFRSLRNNTPNNSNKSHIVTLQQLTRRENTR